MLVRDIVAFCRDLRVCRPVLAYLCHTFLARTGINSGEQLPCRADYMNIQFLQRISRSCYKEAHVEGGVKKARFSKGGAR